MLQISVILPVYNGGAFLEEAIRSILNQTEKDFELIIIDDGSTDGSAKLISSFSDPRIRSVQHSKNKGLIATLNEGIDLAKGEYIARMDSDDISLPERFAIQLQQFTKNPGAAVVCSPITIVTSGGQEKEAWPADQAAKTTSQIHAMLPDENCIAHPSVMVRADVMRKYRYSENQPGNEDWDLWLRLARDKMQIVKTRESLLRYRMHGFSLTGQMNAAKPAPLRRIKARRTFVLASIASFRINTFVLKCIFHSLRDRLYYWRTFRFPHLGRQIKWFSTISIVKASKQFSNLTNTLGAHDSSYFLFFPHAHAGGAEKVHARIAKAISDVKPFIFITGLADKGGFEVTFPKEAQLLSVSAALYHPLFSKRSSELVLSKILSVHSPYILGANNRFFYELIPELKINSRVFDLVHDYDYVKDREQAQKELPASLRCEKRIFVSKNTLERTIRFYKEEKVDDYEVEKLLLIQNAVEPPFKERMREWKGPPFTVIYSGRDTEEKRVDLIIETAKECATRSIQVNFWLVGDIRKRNSLPNVSYLGLQSDPQKLSELYWLSDFVIITSSSEGFPLALAEGMMHGCIPVSTPVGDIPFHLGAVGAPVTKNVEAKFVPKEITELLARLINDPRKMSGISSACITYARETFSSEKFEKAYRELFGIKLL